MAEDEDKYTVHLYRHDRAFLEGEALRIIQQRYRATSRLEPPSVADVVTDLLDELRTLRSQVKTYREMADACTCGASTVADAPGDEARLL